MTDRDLLELIATQVGALTTQMDTLTTQVDTLTTQVSNIDERLARVEANQIRIENDHGAKLAALFDGQKQITDRLDRIEEKVSSHEEFILKRIK